MRILFLTQIVPYPPDSGPKVKTWNVLRYLSESGHQITLASFVRPDEEAHLESSGKRLYQDLPGSSAPLSFQRCLLHVPQPDNTTSFPDRTG